LSWSIPHKSQSCKHSSNVSQNTYTWSISLLLQIKNTTWQWSCISYCKLKTLRHRICELDCIQKHNKQSQKALPWEMNQHTRQKFHYHCLHLYKETDHHCFKGSSLRDESTHQTKIPLPLSPLIQRDRSPLLTATIAVILCSCPFKHCTWEKSYGIKSWTSENQNKWAIPELQK
jgi:hypothetical protein